MNTISSKLVRTSNNMNLHEYVDKLENRILQLESRIENMERDFYIEKILLKDGVNQQIEEDE